MGHTYVWLDKKLDHPEGPVLGLKIDDDFAKMSRYELCCHIEDKFELERDSFGSWSQHRRFVFAVKLLGTS